MTSETRAAGRVVVSLSGGAGSWAAGRKWIDQHGPDGIVVLFTDTLCEDQDTYRFLIAAAANLFGVKLPVGFLPEITDFPAWEDRTLYKAFVLALAARAMRLMPGFNWISNGEDVWDVFERRGALGSTRIDPCSETLKRKVAERWLRENCDPDETVVLVGIGPVEEERMIGSPTHGRRGLKARKAADGWRFEAPLCDEPRWWPHLVEAEVKRAGLWTQRIYRLGFGHANCGGACCKAGIGQWLLLLRVFPERYAYSERREAEIRELLNWRQTMLRDRRGGVSKPLSLIDLRSRSSDLFEDTGGGGCRCALGDDPSLEADAALHPDQPAKPDPMETSHVD